MKLLIVISGYFPGQKYGGPPVSIDNFCELLQEHQHYIITTNHDFNEVETYDVPKGWTKRTSNQYVLYLSDKDYHSHTFKTIIQEVSPDILYLQGLYEQCDLDFLRLAKKNNIPVLLAPRGGLCSGALKKKYKKIPYLFVLKHSGILNSVFFQSTSKEETSAISHYLGAPHDHIFELDNIPSIPHRQIELLGKEPGIARFVFLSRIVDKKNLLLALSSFATIKGDVVFDIFGPIEDKQYWAQCENVISNLPGNISVHYKGSLSHEQIHSTLSQYHSFLFPTFSENYGHVIVEALTANCIPIISDQTPWNDVNDYGIGWALPLKQSFSFAEAIQTVVDMDQDELDSRRTKINQYIAKRISVQEIKESYLAALNAIKVEH